MPRSLRISIPDAVYHVISRVNGRARNSLDDSDRKLLVCRMRENVLPEVEKVLSTIRKAASAPSAE